MLLQFNRIRSNTKFKKDAFMQTRALRTLTRIATIGSFAESAAQLNMTLSAVSMQMKALEEELGVALFDRTFRPPRLTPAGRAVAAQAGRILGEEEALLDLCAPTDRLAGVYRLGFVMTAGVRLLPGFLRRAGDALPEARFAFETGLSETLEARVLAGGLDAAVVTAGGAVDGLAHHAVRREPLAFAAHRSLMREGPGETLAAHPFLQFRPSTGIGKRIAGLVPQTGPRIVLDSVETIMECVRQQIGVTLLAQSDIERYADAKTAIFNVPGIEAVRELVLTTRTGDPLTAKAHLLTRLF